ncbi:hypothetical protein BCR34DRAFT_523420 [Clohesyomyces aquaticus]|uniref:DUF7580 domain-containing protein n=1 Tax=Clohesyomyces aquaticus TaxID=1231657 RepID=A0A1Y1YM61_9PLEO|nr:hypothetical protein BCR34DRAFT_523420 [Clohesyomyces aquaticus]
MSGLEVAAVVLKTFPVLLQALNAWLPLFQGTKDWFTFETIYLTFISEIRAEYILYNQSMRIFLANCKLDLEQSSSDRLDSGAAVWYDPAVRSKIARQIQIEHFNWFLEQLQTIDVTLKALCNLLPQKNDQVHAPDVGTIDYEMHRLRISFSRDKQQLVDLLKGTTDKINKFVTNETLITRSVSSNDVNIYVTLQRNTKSFYVGLHSRLRCSGPSHNHRCTVIVDWTHCPDSHDPPRLGLLLGESGRWKQLRWHTSAIKTTNPVVTNQLETHSSQLLSQWLRKKWVQSAKNREIGIAAVSATLTVLNPNNIDTESFYRERETEKLRSNKWIGTNIPRSKSARRKDGARSNQRSSDTNGNPSVGAESSKGKSGVLTHSSSETAVVSATAGTTEERPVCHNEERSAPLPNVCAFLRNSDTPPACGQLTFEHEKLNFEIGPCEEAFLKDVNMIDLNYIFTEYPYLPDRLHLGIKFIRTLLCFGTSGLVVPEWNEDRVLILERRRDKGNPLHPCILHAEFCRNPPLTMSEEQTASLFFNLGVFLLELTSKKTLKETKEWSKHSATNIDPNWLPRCVAGDRYRKLKNKYSNSLSEPIRRCLNYGFTRTANLEDKELLREVIDGVVKPLEGFTLAFSTSPQ